MTELLLYFDLLESLFDVVSGGRDMGTVFVTGLDTTFPLPSVEYS